jgi:HK97 family phage portal protein
MTKAERFLSTIGRLRGAYERGVKGVNAPFNDDRSWSPYGGFSGIGSAGQGKKPISPADVIDNYFTSWVYICSSLNARSCASVPLRLYGTTTTKGKKIKWAGTDVNVHTRPITKARRKEFESTRHLQPYITKAADVEEIVEHPFLELIKNVNPFSNMSDLLELTVMFMDLTGDAYWYMPRNGAGVPGQLWILPSQYVTAIAGKTLDTFIEGYKFQRGNSSVILPMEDVIPFSYPNPKSQITGFAPVLGIADEVYNYSQMNIYEASLFENKARVDGLFEVDSTIPMAQVERAKEKFAAEFAGTQAAGKRPLLPPGMKFTKTSMTAEEISFVEGRKLTREAISAGLDVPMSLLDPNSIRSNVDGAALFHAKYGITPRLRKIEEKLNERLLPLYDSGTGMFCAFDDVVPEDKEFQLRARQAGVGTAWLTIDEARSEEGKDALDLPGWSDVPLISGILQPLGTEPPPPPEPIIVPANPNAPAKPDKDDVDDQADELAAKTWKKLKEKLGG